MGRLVAIKDNLINFVTGLGTDKDPTMGAAYNLTLLNRNTQEIAYRSDWLARRIVDAPAEDATREWRGWQAANDQIEKIERLEESLDLQRKVKQAIIRARLYGGSALVMGIEQGNSEDELDLATIKKDDFKFVVVVSCHELSPGPRVYNVMSPYYGRPEYYTVSTPMHGFDGNGAPMTRIHPSRVIEFVGHELPDWHLAPMGGGWGDSVLQVCDEILKDYGITIGGVANMVNDAKLDVIKVPDFSKNIVSEEYSSRLLKRFTFANTSKSSINSLLLDTEEEWERIQTNFVSLPQLISEFIKIVAGAGGIPVSRLMGQAPGKGLSGSTGGGEQDMKNYYDTVAAQQKTVYTPSMIPLDRALVISALGKDDPNIYYEWNPLYQPNAAELAAIAVQKAQVAQADVTMGLINEDVLRQIRVNQLIEDGTYPGIEDAVEEFGIEPPEPPPDAGAPPVGGAAPKPDSGGGGGNKLEIVHSVAKDSSADFFDFNPNHEPAGSSKGGEFSQREGGPNAIVMVSPNVEHDLSVEKARVGMGSLRQNRLLELSNLIDKKLGVSSTTTSIMGAWEHGAEPSTMSEYRSKNADMVEIAAAMKGYLADQKSVLVFRKDKKGHDFVHSFRAKGTLEKINKDMVEDGVVFHSLVPITNKIGRTVGATVLVYDQNESMIDETLRGARRYGSEIEYTRGEGKFLGTDKQDGTDEEQRSAARAAYIAKIESSGSDRVKGLWRDIGPASGKKLLSFEGITPQEQALSVVSVLDPSTPAIKQRSRNVSDIAKDLSVRGQAALTKMGFEGGKITGPSRKGDELLARVIAYEVENGITREGASSTGWYSDKVRKAMELAALTHPELTADPDRESVYKAALAVTSQGEIVSSNVRLTEEVYDHFKAHGRFPTNVVAKEQISMNSNFGKLNALIDASGVSGMREFLSRDFTAGELNDLGYKINENVDAKVYGSAILGPKIGQGFYQNLTGNYDPTTFDLWWMRSWGRITGTLTDTVSADGLLEQETRLARALNDENYDVPRTEEGLMAEAKNAIVRHELDFSKHRRAYDIGEKKKSELTYAAERYVLGRDGVKEQPASGSEREWMRTVAAKAIELLKTKNINITPADLQATWWYPEKHLYDKLGGRDSEGVNQSYADIMAHLARVRGKSEADIERILG